MLLAQLDQGVVGKGGGRVIWGDYKMCSRFQNRALALPAPPQPLMCLPYWQQYPLLSTLPLLPYLYLLRAFPAGPATASESIPDRGEGRKAGFSAGTKVRGLHALPPRGVGYGPGGEGCVRPVALKLGLSAGSVEGSYAGAFCGLPAGHSLPNNAHLLHPPPHDTLPLCVPSPLQARAAAGGE